MLRFIVTQAALRNLEKDTAVPKSVREADDALVEAMATSDVRKADYQRAASFGDKALAFHVEDRLDEVQYGREQILVGQAIEEAKKLISERYEQDVARRVPATKMPASGLECLQWVAEQAARSEYEALLKEVAAQLIAAVHQRLDAGTLNEEAYKSLKEIADRLPTGLPWNEDPRGLNMAAYKTMVRGPLKAEDTPLRNLRDGIKSLLDAIYKEVFNRPGLAPLA
jgi:hypothetical protein